MAKYLFKANIFAKLSEIVEADSEKEVMDKIRNQKSFEIKQKALQVYPASIEIRKIKEKKEKQMTIKDIELIKKMLQMQAKLDEAIIKEYGLESIDEKKLGFAILDEVGELTHELKGNWCWWKKTQEPVNMGKVLEELVDVWHFVLSWQNNFNDSEEGLLTDDILMKNVDDNRWGIESCKMGIITKLADLPSFPLWKVEPLIAITEHLGFSIEQVYKAYCEKNKINYQRLKEGY